MAEREELLQLAADIVSAHAQQQSAINGPAAPGLIQRVFSTLATVQEKAAVPPKPEPAVSIRASVRPDHLVCFDCGQHFSMLKRHLRTDHQLTPEQYRQRWQLSLTYPMVAPAYAKTRSALAKRFGLGRKGSAVRKMTTRRARRS